MTHPELPSGPRTRRAAGAEYIIWSHSTVADDMGMYVAACKDTWMEVLERMQLLLRKALNAGFAT